MIRSAEKYPARLMAVIWIIFQCQTATAQTPAEPPANFYIGGTQCAASTTPKCGGFVAMAIPLAGSDTYSWTKIYQGSPAGTKLPASETTTGLAKRLWTKCFGKTCADVVGLGAIGAATTSSATTAVFNGGGGVLVRGISKRWPWLVLWGGAVQDKSGVGGNTTQVMVSIGGKP